MDSPPSQTIFNFVMTAFGTLLAAVGVLYRGKVDVLEKNQVNYVTLDVLDKHLDKIAEERRSIATAQAAWHAENTRRLERIEDDTKGGLERIEGAMARGLERIHDRIDSIPYRPPQTRTRSSDS